MKINKKNIFILVSVLILSIFIGYTEKVEAASLSLSADKNNIRVGEQVIIKASSDTLATVNFAQTPTTGGSFNPTTCKTSFYGATYLCEVKFTPTAPGTYTISGTIYINGQPVQSNYATNPRITVTQNTNPSLIGEIIDTTPPLIYTGEVIKLQIKAVPNPSAGPTVFISSPQLGNMGTCIVNTTAGGMCTRPGDIILSTGVAGTYDVNFSTNSWPGYNGTVSGSVKVSVLSSSIPPTLPPLPTTGTCGDGKDNDDDKLVDKNDPDCHTDNNATNPNSYIQSRYEGSTVYKYLAPLGEDENFDPGQKNALSKYLNLMIKIAIGIAGVLAVIMIVMGGIQYMTSDLISSKEEGKKRITNAIMGLLIALGAYLILYTINPNLLKIEPDIPATIISFDDEEDYQPILDNSNTAIPSTAPVNCQAGITKVDTKGGVRFLACADISSKLQQMLDAAWDAGVKISGGGFRAASTQITLRRAHCGTTQYDIYQKPSNQCNPPTARPGRSVHESGKAFDLKCTVSNGIKLINWDGRQRRFAVTPETKVCFDWLKANAGKYGFYNLPSENWHWSVNGR